MGFKQYFLNTFNCVVVIDGIEYTDEKIQIDYHCGSDKKYYYKIISDNQFITDLFGCKYIEGVKGFKQHIISRKNYHLIYKEKISQLEIITWDNSLFVHSKLVDL
jgi:hypothetical protein